MVDRKKALSVLFVILACVSSFSGYAEVGIPNIFPAPKSISLKSNSNFNVNEGWVIVADLSDAQSKFNADYLKRHVHAEFGLWIDVVAHSSARASKPRRIILAAKNIGDWWQALLEGSSITDTNQLGDEGYRIETVSGKNRKDIFLVGNKPQGVFYAIQSTLTRPDGTKQLFLPHSIGVTFPQISIEDWPDRPVRGIFGSFGRDGRFFGDINDLSDAFEWVDAAAKLKMNTIVTGDRLDQLAGLDELFDYARQRYIEPAPFLRGFADGAWMFVTEDPRLAEGISVTSEPFICEADGSEYIAKPIIPVDQTSRIQNTGFEQAGLPGWIASDLSLLSVDSQIYKEGFASLAFHRASLDNNQSTVTLKSTRENLISVVPGEIIEVSINTKSLNVEPASKVKLTVLQLTSNYSKTITAEGKKTSVNIPIGSIDWRRHEQAVLVDPDTRYLEISLTVDANTKGNVWFDDIIVRRLNGALLNVIRTDDTDIVVHDTGVTDALLNDADYSIVDGDLKFLSNVNGKYVRFYTGLEPFKIKCNLNENIPPDHQFEVDYDFVVQMVKGQFKNPVMSINESLSYSKHLLPYYKEMMTALDTKNVLYAGSSEVKGFNRDSRNQGMENYQLLQKDINTVYTYLKSLRSDVLIYMWDDMVSPWHNGGNKYYNTRWGGGKIGAMEPVDASLPRVTDDIPREDLVLWSWNYDAIASPKLLYSPAYYESKGFSWVASSFRSAENIDHWGVQMLNGQSNLGSILFSPRYMDPGNLVPAAGRTWQLDSSN